MKLLVIEDNHDLVQVLQEGFEDHNYAVEAAYEGKRGSIAPAPGSSTASSWT